MNAAQLLIALFNAAWQGTLLCGGAFLVFKYVRRWNASTMFSVWSVLLAICLALPFASYAFASHAYTVQVIADSAQIVPPSAKGRAAYAAQMYAPLDTDPASPGGLATQAAFQISDYAPWILALLGVVSLVRLALLARDLVGMALARQGSRRIHLPIALNRPINRPYAFASSCTLASPCVLGFAPALIVIPDSLLTVSREDLTGIVLHEAEHVRRYDDVQNVLHRFIAAIAFFCPGVRIALRELALYREQICDDAAVAGIGDAVAYAHTLTGMAAWAQGRGVPVASLIFTRSQLLRRLELLLDRAVNHSLNVHRGAAFSAAVTLTLAAAIVLHFQVPVFAQVTLTPELCPTAAHATLARTDRHAPKRTVRFIPHHTVKPRAERVVAKRAERVEAKRFERHTHVTEVAMVSQSAMATVRSDADVQSAATIVAQVASIDNARRSDDLLDALDAAGLRNLSVDELIALRNHGVDASLVYGARDYFGQALTAQTLVRLADHGINPSYLVSLNSAGERDLGVDDVVRLRDSGVTAQYITRIHAYNPKAGVDDIIRLRDSGF